MWTIKYKPKNLSEFVNQKDAVSQFLMWIKKWKVGDKALLFHGPAGTGKTALVETYANENKLDLIEMNASDFRTAQQIKEVIGKSIQQQSLFKRGKIFIIDEIDGIAGNADTGGVGEIINIIKESHYPIVITANNLWDAKLRSLRQYCTLVQFKKIPVWDLEKKLGEICGKENIEIDKDTLRQLSKNADGDLRSAINDLQTLSQGRKKITIEDFVTLGFRERETNIFEILKIIFKTQNALTAKLSINTSDKDPDEIFWWIENNVATEYENPEEIARAYDMLSKADLFKRRNRGYMVDFMTGGVATAKKEMYKKFTRYQYPSNIAVLGATKGDRATEKEVLKKISEHMHCSTKTVRKDFLPYLKIILRDKDMRKYFTDSLNLNSEDLKVLK